MTSTKTRESLNNLVSRVTVNAKISKQRPRVLKNGVPRDFDTKLVNTDPRVRLPSISTSMVQTTRDVTPIRASKSIVVESRDHGDISYSGHKRQYVR